MDNMDNTPKLRESPSKVFGVLRWAQGVGLASIAIGLVGLMHDFFWLSVSLVWIGQIILICDLCFKRFRLRFGVIVLLLVAAHAFNQVVVFHNDPYDCAASVYPRDGSMSLVFFNNSTSDYRDFEIVIETVPRTMLESVKEGAGALGCIVYDNEGHSAQTRLEDAQSIQLGQGSSRRPGEVFTDFRRVRCMTIPHQSKVQFEITPLKRGSMISKIRFHGIYLGKYRPQSIDRTLNLAPTRYAIFNPPPQP
jgi:hypothetical protein